jgi:DNA-binding NtrC family response regulator
LVLAFAERHSGLYHPIVSVEPELISFLQTQLFTGNLRELENAVLRMLFAKDRGTSLSLADWVKQGSEEIAEGQLDLIGEAAQNLWKAISERGLLYDEVIRQTEKRIIETAIKAGGETRRQVAKRLRKSERTVYHKIRAHHLSDRAGVLSR